jgi:sec-independent protein translocase protein TatB
MGTPQTIQFASLGMADSLILMVLALVVFGPRRLPQIGRQIGKLMYEFRKASNDFKFQMEEELRNAEEGDRRKKEEERLRTLSLAAPAAETPAAEAGAPAASPYPWESVYPPVATPAAEAQPGETAGQIQPPSTGETVAAAPPNSPAAQGELPGAPEQVAEEAVTPASDSADQDLGAEIKPLERTGDLFPEASPSEKPPVVLPVTAASEASQADGTTPEPSGTITEQAPQHG